MRFLLVHGAPPYRIPGPAIVAGVTLGLLGIVVAASLSTSQGPVICPFRAVTGLPCPSCGLLRSANAIMTGHPGRAFATNPLDALFLLVLFPVGVALWASQRWRGVTLRIEMTRRERRVAWTALIVLVLINWGYVLLTLM